MVHLSIIFRSRKKRIKLPNKFHLLIITVAAIVLLVYYNYNLSPSYNPFAPVNTSSSTRTIFSVEDFILSNVNIDHTTAFKRAWKAACRSSKQGGVVFLVPKNMTYRVRPIMFGGPCLSFLTIKVLGTMEASTNIEDYNGRQKWLVFRNISNFKVHGGGTIDGKGSIWWSNSCKVNKTMPCRGAPGALMFATCKNFTIDGLKLTDAQQMRLIIRRSSHVRVSNLVIKAPGSSPNTDGIHVSDTRHIQIRNSLIGTGDDCISIVNGAKHVEVKDIICGPGHGISIGSLGKDYSEEHVSNIVVKRVRLLETTNGVRIKTWQGGSGYAKNIEFHDITMQNVSNPIIIDQHYCDQKNPCMENSSAVRVDNVAYKNIKGTSATNVAIKLRCNKSVGCKRIVLQDINLVHQREMQNITADFHNVNFVQRGFVSPKYSIEKSMVQV